MSSNVPAGPEIFNDWSLYDKVIHFNFMQHREMAQVIQSVASTFPQPLHVLDLGCGDGRMVREGLRESSVASYVGVDLSMAALAAARSNLSQLCSSLDLRRADLATALAENFDPAPNLILASYSLHHYRLPEVAILIGSLVQKLAAGGVFIWIDLECREQETRVEYLARFYQRQLSQWKDTNPVEKQEIIGHMEESDFPLNPEDKRRVIQEAGLQASSTPYEDEFYVARVFSKPPKGTDA